MVFKNTLSVYLPVHPAELLTAKVTISKFSKKIIDVAGALNDGPDAPINGADTSS